MRAAPPVEAVLSAGRAERMLISLLHAAAAVSVCAWLALHAELRLAGPVLAAMLAAAALMAALMAALGAWLARRALPAAPGQLRWDGQAWHCASASSLPLQRLVVALDLGLWLLLRLHRADSRHAAWRVASAGTAGSSWHGLRVALAAHAGAPATDGGAP